METSRGPRRNRQAVPCSILHQPRSHQRALVRRAAVQIESTRQYARLRTAEPGRCVGLEVVSLPLQVAAIAATRISATFRGFNLRYRMRGKPPRRPPSHSRTPVEHRFMQFIRRFNLPLGPAAFMLHASLRIQSWWRMLHVRRAFRRLRFWTHPIAVLAARTVAAFLKYHTPSARRKRTRPPPEVMIQRAWRRHGERKVFKYFRDLLGFRNAGDPVAMLKTICPNETVLLDPAVGARLRFRLGVQDEAHSHYALSGYSTITGRDLFWPPMIYYKVFISSPLCDVNSFAPRTYATSARFSGTGNPTIGRAGSDALSSVMMRNASVGVRVGSTVFSAHIGGAPALSNTSQSSHSPTSRGIHPTTTGSSNSRTGTGKLPPSPRSPLRAPQVHHRESRLVLFGTSSQQLEFSPTPIPREAAAARQVRDAAAFARDLAGSSRGSEPAFGSTSHGAPFPMRSSSHLTAVGGSIAGRSDSLPSPIALGATSLARATIARTQWRATHAAPSPAVITLASSGRVEAARYMGEAVCVASTLCLDSHSPSNGTTHDRVIGLSKSGTQTAVKQTLLARDVDVIVHASEEVVPSDWYRRDDAALNQWRPINLSTVQHAEEDPRLRLKRELATRYQSPTAAEAPSPHTRWVRAKRARLRWLQSLYNNQLARDGASDDTSSGTGVVPLTSVQKPCIPSVATATNAVIGGDGSRDPWRRDKTEADAALLAVVLNKVPARHDFPAAGTSRALDGLGANNDFDSVTTSSTTDAYPNVHIPIQFDAVELSHLLRTGAAMCKDVLGEGPGGRALREAAAAAAVSERLARRRDDAVHMSIQAPPQLEYDSYIAGWKGAATSLSSAPHVVTRKSPRDFLRKRRP